jgi:hypothetical protein
MVLPSSSTSPRYIPFPLAQRFLQKQQEPEVPVPPPGTFTDVPTQPAQPAPPPPPTFLLPSDNVSTSPSPTLDPTNYLFQTASDSLLRDILGVMRVPLPPYSCSLNLNVCF